MGEQWTIAMTAAYDPNGSVIPGVGSVATASAGETVLLEPGSLTVSDALIFTAFLNPPGANQFGLQYALSQTMNLDRLGRLVLILLAIRW